MSSETVDGSLFTDNRQRLIQKLRGGITVISAYASVQRSNELASHFEQEANFWWLCGVELPNWWLIIDGSRKKSWLVAPVTNLGTLYRNQEDENVRLVSGIDDILTQDAGMQMLRELSKKHSIVRTLGEQPRSDYLNFSSNPAPRRMYDVLDRIFNTVQDCRRELAQLRAIKQPEEIARIKRAINLTVTGFDYAKAGLREVRNEYEIEASITYHFRKHGAKGNAYDPVVAAGINACNLQYATNNGRLRKREVVLLDAGAKVSGYAASLARTYSYGEPTQRQIAVHDALNGAHRRLIKLLEPNLAIDKYQREADAIMKETLLSLGLLVDQNDTTSYRQYLPHAVSHGIGVDVYDGLGSPHFFQPGMVLAVEPGIYIQEERIGMRLKDMILITTAGSINLSKRLSTDL